MDKGFFSAHFTDHWFHSAVQKFWLCDTIFTTLWFLKYWSRAAVYVGDWSIAFALKFYIETAFVCKNSYMIAWTTVTFFASENSNIYTNSEKNKCCYSANWGNLILYHLLAKCLIYLKPFLVAGTSFSTVNNFGLSWLPTSFQFNSQLQIKTVSLAVAEGTMTCPVFWKPQSRKKWYYVIRIFEPQTETNGP